MLLEVAGFMGLGQMELIRREQSNRALADLDLTGSRKGRKESDFLGWLCSLR